MSSSHAILYPTPPPTTNNVEPKQRLRLRRSTKKLGALLGTTPRVAEHEAIPVPILRSTKRAESPDSVKSRRQGSIFTRCPSPEGGYASSTTSAASFSLSRNSNDGHTHENQKTASKSRRTIDVPRPLVLHLNVPSYASLLPPTPSTATTILTPSTASSGITPITPVFPTPAESRRKRMAKLTRTLGEIVPPQLVFASKKPSTPNVQTVFPEKACPVEGTGETGRRRSMSVDFSGSPGHSSSRSSRVWVTGDSTWRGEWNRKDIRVVQNELRSLRLG